MKKMIFLLVVVLLPILSFGQVIPAKPDFIPDCNLPGEQFMTIVGNNIVYKNGAGDVYAKLLNSIGETVNIPSDSAILFFEKTLTNNPINVFGYVGGLSKKESGYCISFSERISYVSSHYVCKINDIWDLYQRQGCGNPVLVYKQKKEKEIMLPAKQKCCDTTIVNVVVNNNISNNIPELKCPESKKDTIIFNQGCPKDNWSVFYPLFGMRTIYSSDLNKESAFAGLGLRMNWTDTCKLFSIYTGADLAAFVVEKTEISCDTCTEFVDVLPKKLSFRGEIFCGIEAGLKQLTNLKGFAEARYAILQPQVLIGREDRQFLPKHSGLTMSAGLRYNIGIFETSGFYEYDPLAKMSGGGIKISILFGRNKKPSKK